MGIKRSLHQRIKLCKPLCAKHHKKKSVLKEHNIAKNFTISSTKYCAKIQTLWRNLSAKGQDLQPLRQYCIRNCHAAVMNIDTWVQGYFGKPLLLNTVQPGIQKSKLKF